MSAYRLVLEHRTHVGLVRQSNQDYLACYPEQGVFLLADGMGGHRAGEVAARIAVDSAAEVLLAGYARDAGDALQGMMLAGQAVEHANLSLRAAAADDAALEGMGTTLVLALFRPGRVFFAHVGDSRLYRLRDGVLHCLTRDHSLVQELIDQGVYRHRREAHAAGIGDNILTRSLGIRAEVEADLAECDVKPGDLYLACSDGLCGRVADTEILRRMSLEEELNDMADGLLRAALDAGGRDNISLILARSEPAG